MKYRINVDRISNPTNKKIIPWIANANAGHIDKAINLYSGVKRNVNLFPITKPNYGCCHEFLCRLI